MMYENSYLVNNNDNNKSSTVLLAIIILLFSIDLVTYIPLSVVLVKSIDMALVIILSLYFFKISQINEQYSFVKVLIVIYLLLLSVRLFNDFVLEGIVFFVYKNKMTIFAIVLVTMIIPYNIFYRYNYSIDTKKLFYIIGIILTICLGISARNILLGNNIEINTGQFNASDRIDVIYYGHLGVTLTLIGLFFVTKKLAISNLLSIIFILVGIISVSFSGSRGPVVAFLCCVSFIMLCKSNIRMIIIYALVGVILYIYLPTIILSIDNFFQSYNISSFHRIAESFIYDGKMNSSGRNSIYMYGWSLFLDNPVLGYRYLLPDNSYVHNIFIEQFMALGLIGGILFLLINLIVITKAYQLAKNQPQYMLIATLYLQYMIFGCFSRSIIAIPQYWLFLFLTLGLYESNRAK